MDSRAKTGSAVRRPGTGKAPRRGSVPAEPGPRARSSRSPSGGAPRHPSRPRAEAAGPGRRGPVVTFRWRRHPGGHATARLRALASTVLSRLGHIAGEVGVLVCDDPTIRSLNRHFRGKDAATDVLSFPAGFAQPDGPPYLGDVAISLETAVRQAKARGVEVIRELEVLLVHALVHLSGYDHETDDGEMATLEARLRRELLR